MMNECEIYAKDKMCCCKCKYRLDARNQDDFIGESFNHACIAFAFCEGEGIAWIGDFSHGGCELFEAKPLVTKRRDAKLIARMIAESEVRYPNDEYSRSIVSDVIALSEAALKLRRALRDMLSKFGWIDKQTQSPAVGVERGVFSATQWLED